MLTICQRVPSRTSAASLPQAPASSDQRRAALAFTGTGASSVSRGRRVYSFRSPGSHCGVSRSTGLSSGFSVMFQQMTVVKRPAFPPRVDVDDRVWPSGHADGQGDGSHGGQTFRPAPTASDRKQ